MASRTSAILLLLFAQALSVAYTERRTLSTNLPSTAYMQPRQPGLLTLDFTFEFAERTEKHRRDIVSSVIWFEIKLFQSKAGDFVLHMSLHPDKVIASNPGQLLKYYAESTEPVTWSDTCPEVLKNQKRTFSCPDISLGMETGPGNLADSAGLPMSPSLQYPLAAVSSLFLVITLLLIIIE